MTAIKPDPVPTEAVGIERNVRDGILRMDTNDVEPMEFPANPWRAADGGGVGVHACSVPREPGVAQDHGIGGVYVRRHTDRGVSA